MALHRDGVECLEDIHLRVEDPQLHDQDKDKEDRPVHRLASDSHVHELNVFVEFKRTVLR